ncbi:uncharacterized protein LOC132062963 [Lycium ferocissimum]|uniref:uncharacterized protein LOC132062963 n=1 Tax=Lycium ferocissimum TaxID=112874 RepID=UPI0028169647|nr:uncharacterized protein LOC132062963 [Lycium ferocissimum]
MKIICGVLLLLLVVSSVEANAPRYPPSNDDYDYDRCEAIFENFGCVDSSNVCEKRCIESCYKGVGDIYSYCDDDKNCHCHPMRGGPCPPLPDCPLVTKKNVTSTFH